MRRYLREVYILGILLLVIIPLTFSAAPTHSTPILNASSSNNLTNDNLIALNVSTADGDSNDVFNNFNWYVEDRSLTVLSMSFDRNDTSTTSDIVMDYSGYGNNGSLGSGNASRVPRWTANGVSGGAYSFDGIDDRFIVDNVDSLDLNTTITLEAWVYMNTTSGDTWNTFVGKYVSTGNQRSYILGTNEIGNSRVAFCLGTLASCEYLVSPNVLPLNSWQHVVATYDGEVINLYENGFWVKSMVYINGSFDGTGDVSIGGSTFGGLNFNGSIDEVRIYNYTLTSGQIQTIYNNGVPKYNLINYTMTSPNKTWSVNVTPMDLNDDGQTLPSNNLTILNTQPTVVTGIYPSTIRVDDDLLGYVNFTDTDGDTDCGGYYRWYVNGTVIEEGDQLMLFLASFDYNGSSNMSTSDNEIPLRVFNYTNFTGKFGRDVYISTNDILKYSAINNINREAGSVLFWLQPDWNVSDETKERPFFQDENRQFYIYFNPVDNGITLNMTINNTYQMNVSTGNLSGVLNDNEWSHVIVAWNRSLEKVQIYVNGMLYVNNTLDLEWFSNYPLIGENIYIGSTNTQSRSASSHFDEFAIFSKDLESNHLLDIWQREIPMLHQEDFLPRSKFVNRSGENITFEVTPYDCTDYGAGVNSTTLAIPVADLYYTDAYVNKTVIGSQGSVHFLAHWYSTSGLDEAWLEVNDSGYLYNTSVREAGFLLDDMAKMEWMPDTRSAAYDTVQTFPSIDGYIGYATNISYQFTADSLTDYVYVRHTLDKSIDLTSYDFINYYVKADTANYLQTRLSVYNVSSEGSLTYCDYTAYPDITGTTWQKITFNVSIFQGGDCDLTNISMLKVTLNDIDNSGAPQNGSVLFDEVYLSTSTAPTDIPIVFNYKPNITLPSNRNITLRMFMKDNSGYINSTSIFNVHVDTDVPQLFDVNFTNNYSNYESELKFRGVFNDSTQISSFWFEIENDSTRYNTSARAAGYYIDTFDDPNWVYASGVVKGPNVTLTQNENGYIGKGLSIDYNYSNGSGTDYFFLEIGIDPLINISQYDALSLQVKADDPMLHQIRLDIWCEDETPPESNRIKPKQALVPTDQWTEIEFLTKEYWTENLNCSLTKSNVTRLKLEFGDINDSALDNGTILIDELRLVKKDSPYENKGEVPLRIDWINFDEKNNFSLRVYFNDTTGNENYTRWFNITQQDFDSGALALVHDNGSLLDEVRLWRNNVITGNWSSPTVLEKKLMKNYTFKILEGIDTNNITLLQEVASNLTGLGFELVNYSDNVSGYDFYLVREINDTIVRGWGVFLFNPSSSANVILEVPHSQWDTNSSIVAMNYFLDVFPKALVINSVQRYANRKHDSDAGHSVDMMFHSVHEALIENTSSPIVIQIHGYAASGFADSSWQVIISDAVGINKSQILLDIEQAFLNQSYKTCVWPYNCSYLSGNCLAAKV